MAITERTVSHAVKKSDHDVLTRHKHKSEERKGQNHTPERLLKSIRAFRSHSKTRNHLPHNRINA